MAVSYLSRTFKPSPYVLPLDLNLFERVMTIKEKTFDANVAKEQAEIDQMGALDVLKAEDRDYLNKKIGNIVSTLNNSGGIDFSDMNNVRQVESLGSDVYADDKVLSALSSTASVRNLVNTYRDFKTNPKLKGLYSEVNESYDMRKVNEWIGDGQVGSSYHGSNTATPYVKYKDNILKAMEKVKADMNVTLDDRGLFIVKTTNEHISPDRIFDAASKLLTPDEAGQMKRDSWYLYNVQSPTAPEQLLGKGMQQYYKKVQNAKTIWETYEDQAKAAASDPQARENYNYLATNAKKEYDTIKGQETSIAQSMMKSYQNDPESFGFELYKNDFLDGVASRFSVNRTDRAIQADTAEMFERKFDQTQAHHVDAMTIKERELDIREQEAAIKAFGAVYKTINPKTGKVEYLPNTLSPKSIDTSDPDDLRTSVNKINTENVNLIKQADEAELNWLYNFAIHYPEIFENQSTTQGTGLARTLKGQAHIESYNGRPGFQIEDLGALNRAETVDKLTEAGWTPEQVAYMSTVYKNFQNMTLGKGDIVSDLPHGVAEVAEKRNLANLAVEANNEKIALATKAATAQAGLTNDEQTLMEDYVRNPSKYVKGKAGDFVTFGAAFAQGNGFSSLFNNTGQLLPDLKVDPRIERLEKKLKNSGVDIKKEVKKHLDALPTRDQFNLRTISEAEAKALNFGDFAAVEYKRLNPDDGEVSADSFKSFTVGTASDGTFYADAQHVNSKGAASTVRLPLDASNASKVGLTSNPYSTIDLTARLRGSTGEIPVYGTKQLSVSVNVVMNNARNVNDDSSFAQVVYKQLDENGQPTGKVTRVKIPASDGRTPSEAYVLAKTAIQDAAKKGITFDQFKEYLMNYKN